MYCIDSAITNGHDDNVDTVNGNVWKIAALIIFTTEFYTFGTQLLPAGDTSPRSTIPLGG